MLQVNINSCHPYVFWFQFQTFQELEEGSNHELKKIQDLEVKDDIQVALEIPSEFELSSKTCIRVSKDL